MIFNSIQFLIFLPIVFICYHTIGKRYSRIILLIASYYFYGSWNPLYLLLIFGVSILIYFSGLLLAIFPTSKGKKVILWVTGIFVFGILGYYKYLDFFVSNVNFFLKTTFSTYNILLPVGISFFSFQAISYLFDVARKTIPPERNLLTFLLYVSFFPQLVAGPIERSNNLLPQLQTYQPFNYSDAVRGMRLILWGLLKKMVIADRLALYVDSVYGNQDFHSGISLITATLFFSFQIYCDFSGYSDIAIGCGKLFGVHLMENFRRPYFASSIREFWRKWHISLTTWFRDYLYFPLGGNRVSASKRNVNLIIVFLVSGLWHGANWTFILWGAIHGVFQIITVYSEKHVSAIADRFISAKMNFLKTAMGVALTFTITSFAWIFFRAPNIGDAFDIVSKIITLKGGTLFYGPSENFIYCIFSIIMLIGVESIIELRKVKKFLDISLWPKPVRYMTYTTAALMILLIGVLDGGQFIYFQF